MGIFVKNNSKTEKEPAYYISAINTQTLNYKVYYMSFLEKLAYFLLAFIVGAAVGYLFYGGIGKDEFGQATSTTKFLNIFIPSIVGILAGKLFLPIRVNQIKEKRIKNLKRQFRDMLEALTTSLGAGKNVNDSFIATYEDLIVQYPEEAYIISEIKLINTGVQNNIPIEELLWDFGVRSGIDDIRSFANVFKISYRKGGNIKDIIRNTNDILKDKMDIVEDIETVVASNKMEQTIMIFMPIGIVAMIKMMSPEFGSKFTSVTGVISTTIAVGMFLLAYYVGKQILNIKV